MAELNNTLVNGILRTDILATNKLKDSNGSQGTSGQFLKSDGTNIVWGTPSDTHYTYGLGIKAEGVQAVAFTQDSTKNLNFKGSGATTVSTTADSGVITISSQDTNTHRPIQMNGTEILGNNTTALNLKAGTNISLTNSNGTVTITGTDTNTHYTSKNIVGASASAYANAQATNGNVYLNHIESNSNTPTSSHKITGSGATSVTSDASGNITISSTDNDHNYYHSPVYASGLKIGTGTGVNDLYVPDATASQKGVALLGAAGGAALYNHTHPEYAEAMHFKGTLGTGGTITSLPTASASLSGHTYKVITAGTYASIAAKVGDAFICGKAGTATTYSWILIPSGDDIEDTWRGINVNGAQLLGNGISTGAVNFKSGTNIIAEGSGNNVSFSLVEDVDISTLSVDDVIIGNLSVTGAANFANTIAGSISGNAATASKVNNAITFNNGGSGVASGTTFDGSTARTISYNTVGAAASSHSHGSITNAGAIGSTSGYAVYTTTNGVLTAGSLATSDPTASGTSTSFIKTISQDAKGKITVAKANLPEASTTVKGIIQINETNANAFLNSLSTGSSTPLDADYYISQYAGGGTTTTTYHRRPVSALWEYIKGKANTTYLALSGGTMAGTITTKENTAMALRFRNSALYYTGAAYETSGNEALVFGSKNAVTSFMFVNGMAIDTPSDTQWTGLTPGLQIKNNCVSIGKLIANGTTPTYKLDVNGVANSTSYKVAGTGEILYNSSSGCLEIKC